MSAESSRGSEQLPKRQKVDNPPTKGRRRAACKTCSHRKVKCDNVRPECGTCQATNQVCEYPAGPDESWTLDRMADTFFRHIDIITQELHQIRQSMNPTGHMSFVDRPIITPYVETPAHLTTYNSHDDTVQPSENFSHIPPHRTTADEVLNWPIFGGGYPNNYFIDWHLGDKLVPKTYQNTPVATDDSVLTASHNMAPLEESRIPSLVDNFLKNVHTKNPILDVEELVRKSRQHASQGLTYDGYSCLLLMACALGLVARPFGSELEALNYKLNLETARQICGPSKDRDQGDHCFMQATRRLGGLKPGIIAAQCYFFAGVYLMYTLRPMNSWRYFFQASITYQLYLKMQGRVDHENVVSINDPTAMERPSTQRARLEQRLYWSCFKSEAEFRVELPLPQSELASYKFPNAFPSPPSPIQHSEYPVSSISGFSPVSEATSTRGISMTTLLSQGSSDEVRMHAKELCNEEESWYYYLTEVALRRIGNCIINTFFQPDPREWMRIERYLHAATEFETQVTTWQTHLPPAMQKYETNSTIRAPRVASPGGAEASFVSRELSWATENRLLEMRHWLYQPFLYYLIHVRPEHPGFPHGSQADEQLSPAEINQAQSTFWMLITRAIDCNMTILETRSIPHRHHGLWYDLRAIVCSSLILLGVIKAGYIDLISDGRNVLIGNAEVASLEHGRRGISRRDTGQSSSNKNTRIRGRFGRVLRQLDIWSHESPDMLRARELLEVQIRETFQI